MKISATVKMAELAIFAEVSLDPQKPTCCPNRRTASCIHQLAHRLAIEGESRAITVLKASRSMMKLRFNHDLIKDACQLRGSVT